MLSAQKNDLFIKSGDKGFYLDHKVVAKESFFAIGRMYNVSPKYLATYNKLDISKGLLIDQKLHIPLTDTNFTQSGDSGTPVYFKTDGTEELVKISKACGNVLLPNLRHWNNISGNNAAGKKKLIIGFLQTKGLPSITIASKPKPEEPVVKKEEKPVEPKPVVNEKVVVEEKPVIAKEEKPVVVEKPIGNNYAASETNEYGFFKTAFINQVKETPITKSETVTAGIFKTTSGWQDEKYYLLIDEVAPGTIIKIINPTNDKVVYAKVLGGMSGIRQNIGYTIRISNAAASILQITDTEKFILKINY